MLLYLATHACNCYRLSCVSNRLTDWIFVFFFKRIQFIVSTFMQVKIPSIKKLFMNIIIKANSSWLPVLYTCHVHNVHRLIITLFSKYDYELMHTHRLMVFIVLFFFSLFLVYWSVQGTFPATRYVCYNDYTCIINYIRSSRRGWWV